MKALYIRVSTQEQATEGYSIEEQIDRLKKFCEAMGWKDYKVYTDGGYSGGDMNRPALQKMIKDIKAGNIDKVIVYKLDRLSRSQKDTLTLIEDDFLAHNCEFESVTEKFDTSTPFGRAMIGILAVFAQLEREQIKERMSMGKEGRAKEGKWGGGANLPVGYDYIDGELVVNEYEKMQILEALDLYLQGLPTVRIEKIFREKGYRHKYGFWTYKRIQGVFDSKVYIGQIKWGNKWYQGTHEAIISEDLHNKAQEIKAARSANYKAASRRPSYFGGLLFCKHCGGRYCSSNIRQYKYYACHSRRKQNLSMIKDPNCKNKNYNMDKLDEILFAEIKKLAIDTSLIRVIQEERFSNSDKQKEKLLHTEIKKIDSQRSRFMELYGLGVFGVEELQAKISEMNEQKINLEKELAALTEAKSEMTVEQVQNIVSGFEDLLDRGVYEEIRLVIESLIERIDIDNENIIIKWRFA